MRVGLLLLWRSLRQTPGRLLLIALAVGVGAFMLFSFTAVYNAYILRYQHIEWERVLSTSNLVASQQEGSIEQPDRPALYAAKTMERWRGTGVFITAIYADSPDSPALPGLPNPGPGEYYLSPGVAAAVRQYPEDELPLRFGDRYLGLLPEQYVDSPDSLFVLRGLSRQEAQEWGILGSPVYELRTEPAQLSPDQALVRLILYNGVSILLFPVVLFVATASRLGSAQREQRYAALRLVGASRSQVTATLGLETLLATVAGLLLGSCAYWLALPLLQQFRLNGVRFWPADVRLEPLHYLLISSAIVLFTLLANWWGMRHVRTSPLGVARRQPLEGKPRWWRALPLLVGLATILFVLLTTEKDSASAEHLGLVLVALVAIMIGLVVIGPWLTRALADRIARRTANGEVLLASKYIDRHAGAVFGSVAGLVVALFAGSFYLTTVSGVSALEQRFTAGTALTLLPPGSVLVLDYSKGGKFDDSLISSLREQSYVQNAEVIEIYAGAVHALNCEQLAIYTELSCPADGSVKFAAINFFGERANAVAFDEDKMQAVRAAAGPEAAIRMADDISLALRLRGADDLEKLRTFLHQRLGLVGYQRIWTLQNAAGDWVFDPLIEELAFLTYLGMGVTMLIAIGNLIVSTTAGLLERKRSLLTLRLGGMKVGALRRVVALEALVPLLATVLLACGLGIAIGFAFMHLVSRSLDAQLTPAYFGLLAAGLLVALVGIGSVLPLMGRLTAVEVNRTE